MKQAFRQAALVVSMIPIGCVSRGEMRPAAGGAPARAATPAQPPAHEHAMHALPASAGPGFTVADVQFMQGMIGHHAQAVTMSQWAPANGAGDMVRKLAEKIDISQRDEIAFMRRWLADRNQAVPDDAAARAMTMPGMLTPAQMVELEAARGTEFDRLFLTYMIQHHRGAVSMVEDLFDSPAAGQDPDIFRFATDVDVDQRDEIFVMQSMLDMLDTDPGSRSR